MLAPICLFAYNRLNETERTIEALKNNFLAAESELYIFSDGPKNLGSKNKVDEVRQYLRSVPGFKRVTVVESIDNKGLAKSIISGVSQVLGQYDKVIVLEDDLITTPNFLNFMNQALDCYKENAKILSISGYTMDLPSLRNYHKDFYVGYRAASWGWATWKGRWGTIDWEVDGYRNFRWDFTRQFKFMRGGADMPYMLWKQMNGKLDSWAIRLGYHQFVNDLLTVFPAKSKLKSIGFGEGATHTKNNRRFMAVLDQELKTDFIFDPDPCIEPMLIKEFSEKFSLKSRFLDKFNLM
jgi:glycosyltransferase involved in cell wall biosynthesis